MDSLLLYTLASPISISVVILCFWLLWRCGLVQFWVVPAKCLTRECASPNKENAPPLPQPLSKSTSSRISNDDAIRREESILEAVSILFREDWKSAFPLSRSSRSSTSASSEESLEDDILESLSTLFQEEYEVSNDEDVYPNLLVARILPRDRLDYEREKPNSCKCNAEVLRNTVKQNSSSALFQGAVLQANQTILPVSYFNSRTSTTEEQEEQLEPVIALQVDATAPSDTLASVRYRVKMNLHRAADESARRTLDRLLISLKRRICRQDNIGISRRNMPRARKTPRDEQSHEPASLWIQDVGDEEDEESDYSGYTRFEVSDSMKSSTMWQELSRQAIKSQLRMELCNSSNENGQVVVPIVACPPTILSVHTFQDFGAKVFAGVPLVLEVEAIHASQLVAIWFVDGVEVHRGSLAYTPQKVDVGKHISVLLIPLRPDHDGSGCEEAYEFANAVEELPHLPLIHTLRESWVSRESVDNKLRVISYNLLADLYATRETENKMNYCYCPVEFLDKARRMPLLLYELLEFKPDVICLQEVDYSVYSTLLRPCLESRDYQGFYSNKSTAQLEGCAMFWSLECFQQVKPAMMHSFFLRDMFQDGKRQHDEWTSIRDIERLLDEHRDLAYITRQKVGQVLQVAELRIKEPSPDKPNRILVGNTHLFYHPMADHIRAIQIYQVCHRLESLRQAHQNSSPCPFVLCGDFNSSPLSGAVQLLVQGRLEPDHPSAWRHLYDYEWAMGDEDYLAEHGYIGTTVDSGDPPYEDEAYEDTVENPLPEQNGDGPKPPLLELPSSFPNLGLGYEDIPPFTNYSVDFEETLDYIFASLPSEHEPYGLVPAAAAPMPSIEFMKNYSAMPNENMPSDHVSLVCDFAWTKF